MEKESCKAHLSHIWIKLQSLSRFIYYTVTPFKIRFQKYDFLKYRWLLDNKYSYNSWEQLGNDRFPTRNRWWCLKEVMMFKENIFFSIGFRETQNWTSNTSESKRGHSQCAGKSHGIVSHVFTIPHVYRSEEPPSNLFDIQSHRRHLEYLLYVSGINSPDLMITDDFESELNLVLSTPPSGVEEDPNPA